MHKLVSSIFLLVLALQCLLLTGATIRQVPMGGGGYVTGIVVHPKDPSVRYLRTDVGGTYRWDNRNQQWLQLAWDMGTNYRQYCTDGIAVDPQDPSVVYICVGNGTGNGTAGIYKSVNSGQNWTLVKAAPFFGNSHLRQVGECIQVDPHDSRVLYCGTRGAGLLMSRDAGTSWTTANDVPANYTYPKLDYGIRSIAIDASQTTADGRSAVIYASVYSQGVYMTADAGASWQLLKDSPKTARTLAISSDGTLYMTSDDGVWRYRDHVFADISPSSSKRIYNALAVDAHHRGRLIVCHKNTGPQDCMNMNIYLTDNGGQSWTQKNQSIRKHDRPPWWPDYYWSSATAALCFHPQDSKQVWLTDWYGVWYTPNIDAEIVDWHAQVKGHEECVTFSAASLSQGPVRLLLGTVDNGLLYYTDIAQYPPTRSSHDIRDIAWCAAHPEHVVLATASRNLLISKDYGVTQQELATTIEGKINKVAVSAGNPDNWVVLPNKQVPYYTLDGGKTWQPSTGAGANTMSSKWSHQVILAADGADGRIFYYSGKDGLYRSDNGGANFAKINHGVKDYAKIYSLPGQPKQLCLRYDKKLLYSTDAGATLHPVAFFKSVNGFAVGKGKTASCLAWFAIGTPMEETQPKGLYLSDDHGASWRLLCESKKLSLFGLACGDMQEYGRCYLTASGLGCIVVSF